MGANRWIVGGLVALVVAVVSFFAIPPLKQWLQGEFDAAVHDYIVENPEVIPEAMERLQERRTGQLVAGIRSELETPFEGAWAGAAEPAVTVVEFFDYACGYCRASLPDIERLLREHDDVRIVFRELPILSPESEQAARVSLAAARQHEFFDFHRAMYGQGRPSAESIAAAQREVGLDAARVSRDIADAAVTAELHGNVALAQRLELTGTPAFVVGDRILSGAVGYDRLVEAIEEARGGD